MENENSFEQKRLESIIDSNNFDLTRKADIKISLVTTNLEDNVTSYSLELNSLNTKSTNGYYPYDVEYNTYHSNFIGVIHSGRGYEFIVTFKKSYYWWSPLVQIYQGGRYYWYVTPRGNYYKGFHTASNYNHIRMTIYSSIFQGRNINYKVVKKFDKDKHYRGRYCRIGTFDYNGYGECYVGSSPYGTHTFVYPWWKEAYHKNFYYTPINGNQCPLPGTWYDGANCFYKKVPVGCEPYTWQRNWLVKSEPL